MDFKIIIGSKVVRSERIGYQQQGFTQQIQAENINLSVCVSLEKFVSMMKREYDQYVSEVKDMWANKTEQDDDDPLCQAGWPGFRQVVEDQNLLGFVIEKVCIFNS